MVSSCDAPDCNNQLLKLHSLQIEHDMESSFEIYITMIYSYKTHSK